MANELSIPKNFGPLAGAFAGQQVTDDLSAGVQGGFGLITYKGKVWSLRYRGESRQLMREDGDGPRNSIEIVTLKASTHISKIFYENDYVEGSTASPDCFSTNGVTPDIASVKKQAATCASCPKNAWGSGKQGKGKACGDSKRLAVVPMGDLRNEAFGGPMLLRVPAASLQDLASFGQSMQALGYPYYSIAIRVAFDPAEAFPKFKFSAIRPLTNEEGQTVLELQKLTSVTRILSEGAEFAAPAQLPSPLAITSAFEQPPVQVAPAPVATPTPAPVAAPAAGGWGPVVATPLAAEPTAAPAVAAAPSKEPEQSFDEALDDKLNDLLPS